MKITRRQLRQIIEEQLAQKPRANREDQQGQRATGEPTDYGLEDRPLAIQKILLGLFKKIDDSKFRNFERPEALKEKIVDFLNSEVVRQGLDDILSKHPAKKDN